MSDDNNNYDDDDDDDIEAGGGLDKLDKLTPEQVKQAAQMTKAEARHLVDNYYIMQHNRIRADGQIRSMKDEPHDTLDHLSNQSGFLEKQTKLALAAWVDAQPVGKWLTSIFGIGPVLAAGCLAHIDITVSPTSGHIWAFAGLDPTRKWEKGKKRPHNARLKTLCWKIGESFVKNSNRDKCFYGHLYKDRKALETERNEALAFKAQADHILATKKIDKSTDAYKAYSVGKLPPAHVHARARRYAVKIFLAHLHDEMYRQHYGKEPPLPYVIEHLGHAHVINPPA